jgi:multidrug efflux pump subunit AcrA (membrane-fusion protein)
MLDMAGDAEQNRGKGVTIMLPPTTRALLNVSNVTYLAVAILLSTAGTALPGPADDLPLPAGSAVGPRQGALERFRKLDPAERLQFVKQAGKSAVATWKVRPSIVSVDIVERGTLQATRVSEVICTLKNMRDPKGIVSTIKWVVEEGTIVKKGDKLVELDDSLLRNERKADAAELAKCVLRAEQAGVVTYYVPEQTRFGAQTSIVAQGEPVREGQKLLQIADLSQMQVLIRVHEAHLAQVRPGQPKAKGGGPRARILVDAFPGRVLPGHVQAVDKTASSADRFASEVKSYKIVVAIDATPGDLKPGMSAEVRIATKQTPEAVLYLPLSSIVVMGKERLCFVVTDKEIQERKVVTGMTSDLVAEIRSGLKEGELVLLAPASLFRSQGPPPEGKKKAAPGKELPH